MKNKASKPWNLNFEEGYEPSLSILIPMHNEEKTIRFKLENLSKVRYPPEKMETILVNDASTDKTLDEINEFVTHNSRLGIKVLNRTEHEGKISSLNFALKQAKGEVIILSDADCFWPADILTKALPYLSSSNVGAIAGRESLLNLPTSLTVRGELFYDKTVQLIRVGESKVHSTIFFQGGFSAFKRSLLDEFDRETDDSGTAFNIVQQNSRALLVADAYFYTLFPTNWINKVFLKIRRANQLQRIWGKCLKLSLREKVVLPKRIALPEIFLHIFNPIIFIALILTTAFVIVEQPLFLYALLFVLLSAMLFSKIRTPLIEIIQNNLILFFAMFAFLKNKQFRVWKTAQESRFLINEEILRERQLI
ncbi:MAG TPA: glycosyltransferase [Acidobacteriota bacterium]|nr:glycosyltransferase [Acidobacteriota bacterium]